MLHSNVILGIRGHLGCEEYEHGILTQNWEMLPLGVPIVYKSGDLDRRQEATRVLSLITPSQNSAGVESVTVYNRVITPIDIKPLYKSHEVLTISEFDVGKFGRLTEFIRDVGGISLVIDHELGRKNVVKSLQELEKVFKYTTTFYYNAWGDKYLTDKDDRYLCVLTFLDLPYCVPLFNTHRVDGIGLSFSGVVQKRSISNGTLQRVFRVDIIYSNYVDNVLFIDGVTVNNINPPNKNMYSELAKMADRKLKVRSSMQLNERLVEQHRHEERETTKKYTVDFSPPEKSYPSEYEDEDVVLKETLEVKSNRFVGVGDSNITFQDSGHQLYFNAAPNDIDTSTKDNNWDYTITNSDASNDSNDQ